MNFKKNWFSVIIWVLFTLFGVIVFSDMVYRTLTNYWIVTEFYLKAGIVLGVLVVFALLYHLVIKWNVKIPITSPKLLEIFVFICVFGLGIFLRCYFLYETGQMQMGMEEDYYFNTAKINGVELTTYLPGMQYLYLLVLRGLFYLFGNHFEVGLIFQLVVQFCASMIWYIAIRKISGILAASVFFFGAMLMPQSIIMGIQYSPNMLFLLFAGIVLCLIAGLLKRASTAVEYKWYTYIFAVLTGAGIGFLSYLDVTGLIFIIPVFAIFFIVVKDSDIIDFEKKKVLRGIVTILSVFAGSILAFFSLILCIPNTSYYSLLSGLKTWLGFYTYKGLMNIPYAFLNREPDIACMIVLFLLVLGAFAFFKNKKTEKQLVWLFLLIGAAVIYLGRFFSESMKPDGLLLYLKLVITGVGMRVLFVFKDVTVLPDTIPENEPVHTLSETKEMMNESVVNNVKVEQPITNEQPINAEVTETPKPKFIENPLPLPKKHVKRTMSYSITVPRYKMKYDIKVADDDDFDIQ